MNNHQLSEVKLTYKPNFLSKTKIGSSEDAYIIFRSIWSDSIYHVEEFMVLMLNRANMPLGYFKLSVGGMSGTVVDARVVFQAALLAHASSILLCHNHPSTNLRPSQADIKLTQKIKSGGELLDIAVLDHLIICEDGYYSFADEGVM